ncbi:hypothetical protein [Legionella saoudiensis]|uniref:hypothetical protein n=1 Tax=Legionella saoudiensis TaxID=1750561 RepID=UPI000730C0F5|nr:hypothetical protein [Legionella saoudiensis]
MNIGQDEIDDFHKCIRRNGFDENDFLLKDKDITDTTKTDSNGLYVKQFEITVDRLSNKKQKCYQGGYATQWNNDFEDDLTAGFFGHP